MPEKLTSFKELPKKVTDHQHVLHLNVETHADGHDIFTVNVWCGMVRVNNRLLTTIRAREAHGFIRKKASELGCAWKDHTYHRDKA